MAVRQGQLQREGARTRSLALLGLGCLGVGLAAGLHWPDARPALPCAPAQVAWDRSGTAHCLGVAPTARAPAGPLLTLGGKLPLNHASAEELRLIPGVGRRLSQSLVDARRRHGGFRSWEQVDQVAGVGGAKLESLQGSAEIE